MITGRIVGAAGLCLALAAGCQTAPEPVASLSTAVAPAPTPTAFRTAAPTPGVTLKASAKPVSYKVEVAPLITRSCAACHRVGGEAASHAVLADAQGKADYAGIKAKIDPIIRETSRGSMPEGGPRFTSAEVATLQAWKDAGTPDN